MTDEPSESHPASTDPLSGELREKAPTTPAGLSRDVGLSMLFQALDMDESPTRIGRFEIIGRLGRGGMGSVFHAHDPQLQRDVALKVLDGTIDDASAEAMREEARALARLAHPNVVAVYELGVERDQVFLAMEYVPGQTIRQRAHGDRPPETSELIDWFVQAGRGLQAVHDAGLVHRDIKPDNLLVDDDGRVRVADFGLALAEGLEPAEVAGTPTYMAPEVVRSGQASPASDQYAYCASLWRLLDPQAPLRSPTADLPMTLRDVLIRGLALDPELRWPSMHALLEALVPPTQQGPYARQRAVLLRRVDRLWIRGVLQASLADGPSFDLPLSEGSGLVDAPWGDADASAGSSDAALSHLFEEGQGSLLLLGEPGAGKTTTLLRLASTLLDEARLDPGAPTPVVLSLASLADHRGGADTWIEQELVAKYGLPRGAVRHWIDAGSLVLMLDGLDEVSPTRRARCITSLNALRVTHGLPMVVTCRTSDYASQPERLQFGHAIVIEPLPVDVVTSQLGGMVDEPLIDSLRTPLMVSLLTRSEASPPPEGARLPWLYERYLEHQLDAADIDADQRKTLTGALGFLAQAMRRAERTELWLEQIAPGWVFEDGRRTLAHVLGIAMLTTACVVPNVIIGTLVEGDAFSGLLFGVLSVPMILVLNGMRIQPVERLRFSLRRLARLLPLCLGLGLVFGTIYGWFYVLWVNVVFGAVSGIVASLTISFEPSLQENRIRPNQGIRQSLFNGLGVGLLGLALGSVVIGYVTVPLVLPHLEPPSTLLGIPHPERSAAAIAGPMLGTITGMIRGGWAVILHVATRLVLSMTTPVPPALIPLLDRAVDLGLMRRVGGGYLFLHRTFRDFMADRYASSA